MCLAIPGQIVQLLPGTDLATADVSGIKRNINIGLLESEQLAVGDWVLIHVGFAMSKVDEQEARASLEFLETLGQAYREEIASMREAAENSTGPPATALKGGS
jgi:hydrogenase expression/formation protein HypC